MEQNSPLEISHHRRSVLWSGAERSGNPKAEPDGLQHIRGRYEFLWDVGGSNDRLQEPPRCATNPLSLFSGFGITRSFWWRALRFTCQSALEGH